MANCKHYKKAPKHHFWINDGNIERIEPIGGDLNYYEGINLKSNTIERSYINGYTLQSGAKKTTEKEFEKELAKVLAKNIYNRLFL